jgi:hypothetical protein
MKLIMQFVGKYIPESYRTKVSGTCLILLGLIGYVNIIWPNMAIGEITMTVEACTASIAGGLGMIGIGRKIDKNTSAIRGE